MRRSARRPLFLSAAIAAAACGHPAFAQSADGYEYARPAPDAGVVYESREVVQGAIAEPVRVIERVAAPLPPAPPLPPVPPLPPMAHHPLPPPSAAYAPPPPPYVDGAYPAPYPPQAYALPADFDRGRWLDDCHDRIRGVDARERGGVIGALIGAIGGGVIGNRAWDGHRTAGTLLGAGVGGLAGLAVGSAVGAAGERRDDDCALYLDGYTAGYPGGAAYPGYAPAYGGYPAYGYAGYGYGGYALVPVLVAVPQQQVIRETVTEEWIEEPVRTRSAPPRRHHAAPAPAPRGKYIKGS